LNRRQDSELAYAISRILRLGMILSASIIAVGIILMLAFPPHGAPSSLHGVIAEDFGGPTLSFSGWLAGFAHGDPLSVLQLGTLVLLATPLVRVSASVLLFFREGDLLYVKLTLVVLAMLLFAILVLGPIEG
jgi:uncharacterized membrane protein